MAVFEAGSSKDGRNRRDVHVCDEVNIVLKQDQETGRLTRGVVKEILTNSRFHTHGVKVRITDGRVGRMKVIIRHNP